MRDQFFDFLHRELIGPDPVAPNIQANGEEILTNDPPRIRYGAGVLFPQATVVVTAQDIAPSEIPTAPGGDLPLSETSDVDITGEERSEDKSAEESAQEDAIALTNAYLPSAMGFSCFVELPQEGLRLRVNAARYRAATRIYKVKGEEKKGKQYEREPIAGTLNIPTSVLGGPKVRSYRSALQIAEADSGLEVAVLSRPRPSSQSGRERRLLTVTLIMPPNQRAPSLKMKSVSFRSRCALTLKRMSLASLSIPSARVRLLMPKTTRSDCCIGTVRPLPSATGAPPTGKSKMVKQQQCGQR